VEDRRWCAPQKVNWIVELAALVDQTALSQSVQLDAHPEVALEVNGVASKSEDESETSCSETISKS
jgi:hypothetical protein